MGKRGPKSADALAVMGTAAVPLGQRPEPPAVLNDRAADVWRRVVNRMPSDWFADETLDVLQCYCEHVAEGEAISLMIHKVRRLAMTCDESYQRYRNLLRDKETQTRAALSCATKMRITHQSSYSDRSSATAKANAGQFPSGRRPWEE